MLALFLYMAVQDGERPVRDAIQLLRESNAYRFTFKVESKTAGGDGLTKEGRGVMAGDLLSSVSDEAPGKIHRVIVATKNEALVWNEHLPEPAWTTGKAFGEQEAGRGLQNPNSLLSAVSSELGAARLNKDGSVSLRLEGAPVKRVAEAVGVDVDGAQWNQSSVTLAFVVDAATGRIVSIRSEGHVQFGANAPIAAVDFAATVTIVEYGGARLIWDAKDSEGKAVPMADALVDLKLDPAKFK